MNINFRAQPDPLLSSSGSTKPQPNMGNVSLRHNSLHPRTACHVKGLKDVPVRVTRDPDYISGSFTMPAIEQGHRHTFPDATTLNLQSLTNKRYRSPQPISYDMKEDIALLKNKSRNTTVLKRKNDLLRKYIPEQSQNMPVPDVRAITPALALRYRPVIMENMNYTSTYLDHEIKILEKLCDVLQTDSVSEIRDWLSKASLNEKELVSNFIRSDITTRDLLNYNQKCVQTGSEAAHLNLQAMLKGQKAMGSIEEEKMLKNINQGSRASKGKGSEKERDNSLTGTKKIRIPTSDSLLLEHSPSRSQIQQKRHTYPAVPQTSGHLLYNKFRAKRSQCTPERNILLKKL